ncbi:hypothetical protein R6Q59_010639 [Mikania micrantha]
MANPLHLPPGCQFFPSEQQLICHYLTLKNNGDRIDSASSNLINDLDLYRFEPFDLPESARFSFGREGKRKHWRSGPVKDIVGAGVQGVVVGTRKTFVFYLGDSVKTGLRTKWIMYEYALVDQKMAEASYVLCRVFAKSYHLCNSSNDIMKPLNENVKTVRHIGIQCDDKALKMVYSCEDENLDRNPSYKQAVKMFSLENGKPIMGYENSDRNCSMFFSCEDDNVATSLMIGDLI